MSMNYTTVVIPAYNEDQYISRTLQNLEKLYGSSINVLVIVDFEKDSTIDAFYTLKSRPSTYEILTQSYGGGPANAIRYGIDRAKTECIVVMMADGSDDIRTIFELSNLVSRGVAVACASRYMPGGQQIGGLRRKKYLSKSAGLVLYYLAGIGTHDPTNSFKAYSRSFLEQIQIESRSGFEIGIELVSKAHRLKLPIAETPTVWLDRSEGNSRFRIVRWIPKYLRWFFNSFARKNPNK